MEREMTLAEIESLYDAEWVLIGNPLTDENLEVISGSVLCHSEDRDEIYRKAKTLHPKRSAVLYIGEMPDDSVIVL